ncbi:MAG: hypothetical protein M3Q32_00230 [Pseudomonadota bacterium]|nr:hypothetical protein [Pseudomonadota bacterium]
MKSQEIPAITRARKPDRLRAALAVAALITIADTRQQAVENPASSQDEVLWAEKAECIWEYMSFEP